jgi:outer membrane lipoprotein SlyB
MLAIPGVGPVVAAGWLAAAATGAVAGGATGGIVGALAGSGTSKENAELYAEAVRRGGAIVTARVPDDEELRYTQILDRGALDVSKRATTYRNTGWKGFDPGAAGYDAEQVRRERETYM